MKSKEEKIKAALLAHGRFAKLIAEQMPEGPTVEEIMTEEQMEVLAMEAGFTKEMALLLQSQQAPPGAVPVDLDELEINPKTFVLPHCKRLLRYMHEIYRGKNVSRRECYDVGHLKGYREGYLAGYEDMAQEFEFQPFKENIELGEEETEDAYKAIEERRRSRLREG